jgi:hypothetical protein
MDSLIPTTEIKHTEMQNTETRDTETLENILCHFARRYALPERYQTLTVFDRQAGHFLLLDEGWNGFERIHRVWGHVDLKDGDFWIQEDRTEEGIGNALLAAGIPESRIVPAFQHPSRREQHRTGELTAV